MLSFQYFREYDGLRYFLSALDPSALHYITEDDHDFTVFFDDENLKAMVCPKCDRIHPHTSRFCTNCGRSLTPYSTRKNLRCPSCNHIHPLEAEFCAACGQSFSEKKGLFG